MPASLSCFAASARCLSRSPGFTAAVLRGDSSRRSPCGFPWRKAIISWARRSRRSASSFFPSRRSSSSRCFSRSAIGPSGPPGGRPSGRGWPGDCDRAVPVRTIAAKRGRRMRAFIGSFKPPSRREVALTAHPHLETRLRVPQFHHQGILYRTMHYSLFPAMRVAELTRTAGASGPIRRSVPGTNLIRSTPGSAQRLPLRRVFDRGHHRNT